MSEVDRTSAVEECPQARPTGFLKGTVGALGAELSITTLTFGDVFKASFRRRVLGKNTSFMFHQRGVIRAIVSRVGI